MNTINPLLQRLCDLQAHNEPFLVKHRIMPIAKRKRRCLKCHEASFMFIGNYTCARCQTSNSLLGTRANPQHTHSLEVKQ